MADETDTARDDAPLAPLVAFGRDLRARGLPVGTGRIVTFLRAVASLGLADRDSLYWAGRVSLVASRADLDAYDAAFDAWYRSLAPSGSELSIELTLPAEHRAFEDEPDGLQVEVARTAGSWRSAADDDEPEPGDESSIRIVASAVEVLRAKSFADLTEEERRRVAAMIDDLTVRAPVASGDEGVRVRHPSNAPPFAPDPGRALRTLLPGTPVAGATARPDPRHQRVDGALLARAAPVRVCRDGRGQTRRGLLLRDATHARHPDAPREGPGSRDARDREAGRGLGGRHPDRRVAQGAARRLEPARRAPRRGRRPVLGRARARRPGAAPGPDGAAAPARPPGGLGAPLEGIAPVRAARARDGGCVAERRRVPVGSQPREPRDFGGCPRCLSATIGGSGSSSEGSASRACSSWRRSSPTPR